EAASDSLPLTGAQEFVAHSCHVRVTLLAVRLALLLRSLPCRRSLRRFGIVRQRANLKLEVRRPGSGRHGHLESYFTGRHKVSQVLVEGLHSVLLATFRNVVTDLVHAAGVPDEFANGLRDDHDFSRHHPPPSVSTRKQALRYDRSQRLRQPEARNLL